MRIPPTRWRYNQGKCILPHDSHKLYRIFKNLISMHYLNCAECCDIGHAHFCLCFFHSQNLLICHKPTNLTFELTIVIYTKLCTQHLWTLLTKVIKWILILQTILKLLHTNLLQIWYKTGSTGYLDTGVSKWHETQVTTSPWAPKALCQVSGDYH